ncbi:sensor histidine kinase [Aequitasia blattaphilus]|uniref:Histidine kinase n=1 Tax=Aequitasia blattaphilus TaxID=2949332 RepID=A0ABT1E8D7_9FIRM|nr:histidine kinase [Aequitasia blattaphilus]MCP1102048.1 histidine kinase [Aequitasia blattaphilus]MCR8614688.1 histidine kinase [Aequitasia blattaphilus]
MYKNRVFKGIRGLGIVLILCLLGYMFVVTSSYEREDNSLEGIRFIGEYQQKDGEWVKLGKEMKLENVKEDQVILKGHFSRRLKENEELHLYIYYLEVQVFNGETEIYHYGEVSGYPRAMQSAGISWEELTIDQAEDQDDITIILSNKYPENANYSYQVFLDNLCVGDTWTLMKKLFVQDMLLLIEGGVLIAFGLLLFILAPLIGRGDREILKKMMFFGLYILTGGIWIFINGRYISHVFEFPLFLAVLDTSLQSFLVILTISYLMIFVETKERRVLQAMEWLCGLAWLCVLGLQALGYADAYNIRMYLVLFNLVISIGVMVFVVRHLMIYPSRRKKRGLMMVSMIVYCGFMVMEMLNFYFDLFSTGKILASGLFVFVLIQAFLFVRATVKMIENSRKVMEYEEEITRSKIAIMLSQIQPHFLYNALNTIHYLCKTNPELAAVTVEKFSKYLRGNMDSLKERKPIPFERELQHLENYLAIERLRFEEVDFEYELEVRDFLIPSLTIQPLVENAIKYGVAPLEEGGVVTLRSYENKKNYYVEIEDNGKGYNPEEKQRDGRSHIGITNTTERIETLLGGSLSIESVVNKGTKVTIKLPKEFQKIEEES